MRCFSQAEYKTRAAQKLLCVDHMGRIDNCDDLIARARQLELYARRHRILFALDVGEFDRAIALCEAAMEECECGVSPICSPAERARHLHNMSALRDFRQRLSAVALTVPAS